MLNFYFKVSSVILVMTLSGLGFMSSAFGQTAVIVNPDGSLTHLGSLGGSWTTANEINDKGQVVGWSYTTGGDRQAFVTGPNGAALRSLGTLGGSSSEAFDINESGQVVGVAETASEDPHAFITGPDSTGMRDLDTLGATWSAANGVNEAGQVVGWLDVGGGRQAFITGPNGEGVSLLGGFSPETSSEAVDINNRGEVVGGVRGEAESGPAPYGLFVHAFVTGPNGVGIKDLGSGPSDGAWGTGINNAGQAIGYSFPATRGGGSYTISFITGPDEVGMTTIELPPDGEWVGSIANDINDTGQVVGYITTLSGDQHAFITGPDGEGTIDLNSYADLPDGFVLTEARGINNLGQVVATLVPEPQTYALMLGGLGLIGFMVRRRKSEDRI